MPLLTHASEVNDGGDERRRRDNGSRSSTGKPLHGALGYARGVVAFRLDQGEVAALFPLRLFGVESSAKFCSGSHWPRTAPSCRPMTQAPPCSLLHTRAKRTSSSPYTYYCTAYRIHSRRVLGLHNKVHGGVRGCLGSRRVLEGPAFSVCRVATLGSGLRSRRTPLGPAVYCWVPLFPAGSRWVLSWASRGGSC